MTPNHQRIGKDRSACGTPACRVRSSRGASFPSVVEPARQTGASARSVAVSFAFCFFRRSWAASTYENPAWFWHLGRCLLPSSNGPIMTDQNRPVQSVGGQSSVSSLIPESCVARQVRRVAAGFNALQRTRRGVAVGNPRVPCAGSLSLGLGCKQPTVLLLQQRLAACPQQKSRPRGRLS
jgi:hypothetical protein